MTVATISTKGQITLPVAARNALGMKPHDRVAVDVRDGAITVRPAPDLFKFKGFLGKRHPREEEKKAMQAYVARRHEVAS